MVKDNRRNEAKPVSQPKKELGIKVRVAAEVKVSSACPKGSQQVCGINYRL